MFERKETKRLAPCHLERSRGIVLIVNDRKDVSLGDGYWDLALRMILVFRCAPVEMTRVRNIAQDILLCKAISMDSAVR